MGGGTYGSFGSNTGNGRVVQNAQGGVVAFTDHLAEGH